MIQLKARDRSRLVSLLRRDPAANVFLLAVLQRTRAGSPSLSLDGNFYARTDSEPLTAVVYATRTGLCVPYALDAEDAFHLGTGLRRLYEPRLLVGPRKAVDRLRDGMRRAVQPRLVRNHRLYVLEPGRLALPGDPEARPALPRDLDMACTLAAQMQHEELGIDPRTVDESRFRRRMAGLIARDQHWVLPVGETFGFQASAGSVCDDGAQVEAVYTPPALRGRGFASRGLAGMCAGLLQKAPRITLHVNEANAAAVQLYDRVGFRADAAFRLISW